MLLQNLITTNDQWIAAELDEDQPVLLRFRPHLQPFIEAKSLQLEVKIVASYIPETLSGLPGDEDMDALDDIEDALLDEVEDVNCVLSAIITGKSQRVWLWYANTESFDPKIITDIIIANPAISIEISQESSHEWNSYAQLLTDFKNGVYTSYNDKD